MVARRAGVTREDKQVTIFLSEVDGEEKPMCGIYFNLHSPYKKTQPITEPAESTD